MQVSPPPSSSSPTSIPPPPLPPPSPTPHSQIVYCGWYKSSSTLKCSLYRARRDPTCGGTCNCDCAKSGSHTCGGSCRKGADCRGCGYFEKIRDKDFELKRLQW